MAGRNVARTLRLTAKVLLEWSCAHVSLSRRTPQTLKAVDFDKLVTLFCRLWNELNRRQMTRYGTAFLKHRGFHGPGMTLRINRRADDEASLLTEAEDTRRRDFAFATEIVEKLKPGLSDTRILFRLDGKAWDPKAKVTPALERSEWDAWLSHAEDDGLDSKFLTATEAVYIETISAALAKLSAKQLRALGTHSSAKETQKDILFNTNAWEQNLSSFLDDQQDARNHASAKVAVYRMVITSREIRQKSCVNRQEYETAYRKCAQSIAGSPDILDAFSAVQEPADAIWGDAFISNIAQIARAFLDFSIYARRGFLSRIGASDLTGREIRESEEAHKRLLTDAIILGMTLPRYADVADMPISRWIDSVGSGARRLLAIIRQGDR